MKLSIYIKNHLLSDIIVLIIISGTIYLAAGIWKGDSLQNESSNEMVKINDRNDKDLS